LRRRAQLTTVRRLFLVVGVLAVLVGVVNLVRYDWASLATEGKPYDFDLNWIAAQRLVDREPLYDRDASRAEGLKLVGPDMVETNQGPFSSYIGLPSTALFYVPFTPFDADTAADLFRVTDLVAMLAAIAIALFALPRPSRLPVGLVVLGAFLFSTATTKSIFLGQVDGFLMLGLAVALLGTARGWWGVVGVGLGVAALLKLSPVLLLVYLALKRKWRALGTAGATMAGILALALAIGRPGDLPEWFRHVSGSVGQGARTTDNQALPAAVARIFGRTDDIIAQLPLGGWRFGAYMVAVAGVAGLWWLRRGKPVEPLDLGVLVLVALLAGPISWDHYLTWSLLVLVLVVDPSRWAGRSWLEIGMLGGALGASVVLARRWTSYPLPADVAASPWLRLTTSEKTYALLLMLGVALWLLLRPAPSTDAPAQGEAGAEALAVTV
jgi:hypothetical protein